MVGNVAVRRGITRTVVLIDRWAIKFPSLRSHGDGLRGLLWSVTRGIQANLSEQDWSGSPGTCPVLWSLAGLVSVYPRCAPVFRELSDAEYESTGFLGPQDRKPHNLGYLDGRLVWIDYDQSFNDRPPCQHIR